ncbi:unnamed protein product, partial [Lampetra fluviatilis]
MGLGSWKWEEVAMEMVEVEEVEMEMEVEEVEEVEEEMEVEEVVVDQPREEQEPPVNGATGDGTGMQISLNKYDRVIKDTELVEVHEILRRNAPVGDYVRVMRLAGLEDVVVEESRLNHPLEVSEQNFAMIKRWLSSRGEPGATYGELMRAMQRAGCHRAATVVGQMCDELVSG